VSTHAGIGEATVFRVFDDKEAVLRACIAAAMDDTQVLAELQSIPLDQPLAARLAEAVYALDAHLTRMGAVIGALHAVAGPRRPAEREPGAVSRRDESQVAVRQAVLDLFAPDQDHLRLPSGTLADAFLGCSPAGPVSSGPAPRSAWSNSSTCSSTARSWRSEPHAGHAVEQAAPLRANDEGFAVSPVWVAWKPMPIEAPGAMVAL
jgi:AcrR family transcriptional regulator